MSFRRVVDDANVELQSAEASLAGTSEAVGGRTVEGVTRLASQREAPETDALVGNPHLACRRSESGTEIVIGSVVPPVVERRPLGCAKPDGPPYRRFAVRRNPR